ncbi:MAG: SDR family NAD(P)-dependent oxidoreductase [Planctomycetes bacterium]|nr:SDR family NAD(P)-dependent oxidoreductase [Planctomycetota bacterium]
MQYWRGKRAVVVGASAGLGRAVAGVLAERGARVAMVARGEETLSAAADQVRAHGAETLAIAADVTIQDDVERLAATVHQHWGGTDIVCHAAGRSMRGNALDTPPGTFRELWDINFLSAVRLCQAFAPQLTESFGHIVLVGSLASKVAPRYLGAYPASKFSIAALAQQLRLELAERGVHVLLVCPGPIARDSHAERYIAQSAALTAAAQKPGGGAKVSAIDPRKLTERILRACERRDAELVVPGRAKLLFALSQLSPRLGDWLLRKMTAG